MSSVKLKVDSNRYRAVQMQNIFWAPVLSVMGGAICTILGSVMGTAVVVQQYN